MSNKQGFYAAKAIIDGVPFHRQWAVWHRGKRVAHHAQVVQQICVVNCGGRAVARRIANLLNNEV